MNCLEYNQIDFLLKEDFSLQRAKRESTKKTINDIILTNAEMKNNGGRNFNLILCVPAGTHNPREKLSTRKRAVG